MAAPRPRRAAGRDGRLQAAARGAAAAHHVRHARARGRSARPAEAGAAARTAPVGSHVLPRSAFQFAAAARRVHLALQDVPAAALAQPDVQAVDLQEGGRAPLHRDQPARAAPRRPRALRRRRSRAEPQPRERQCHRHRHRLRRPAAHAPRAAHRRAARGAGSDRPGRARQQLRLRHSGRACRALAWLRSRRHLAAHDSVGQSEQRDGGDWRRGVQTLPSAEEGDDPRRLRAARGSVHLPGALGAHVRLRRAPRDGERAAPLRGLTRRRRELFAPRRAGLRGGRVEQFGLPRGLGVAALDVRARAAHARRRVRGGAAAPPRGRLLHAATRRR
mmetsp:Transcript_44150/g.103260  ORF Transcript_44150/g.103260 Transcript_44150/m.103260 type:complete len:332 (+) Transcript_44150:1002-1997(+)